MSADVTFDPERTSSSLVLRRKAGDIQEPKYRRVFETIKQEEAQGLLVADHPENFRNQKLIVELAEQARLPAIYADRVYVEAGGLMSSQATNVSYSMTAAAPATNPAGISSPSSLAVFRFITSSKRDS